MISIFQTAVNFTFPPNISNPIIARAELQNRLVADGTPCFVTGWNPMPGVFAFYQILIDSFGNTIMLNWPKPI